MVAMPKVSIRIHRARLIHIRYYDTERCRAGVNVRDNSHTHDCAEVGNLHQPHLGAVEDKAANRVSIRETQPIIRLWRSGPLGKVCNANSVAE